jgi:hypothetical protein
MNRRQFLGSCGPILGGAALALTGCRQYGHVLHDDKPDMVGSNRAGAETFKPLVEESVGKLLARQAPVIPTGGVPPAIPKKICFVGVENQSAEELCDFKDQLCEIIDNRIVQSGAFQPVSRRFVQEALRELRLRPEELFVPAKQRMLIDLLERGGHPFDYLLFAKLNSGTTQNNSSTQRDYLLTLELVDLHTGGTCKEFATIRKGYHKSHLGKLANYGVH